MKAYVADPDFTLYVGDVRTVLAELEPESVHCVVTSPPYWGLRDYGAEGQIGLEPTPEAFVESMVEVFREVRRVLRSDGTCWLNLGDSYAGGGGGNYGSGKSVTTHQTHLTNAERPNYRVDGIKQKDMVGIPWLVAFALRADGWYLRADIIWSKPNPMPESVTDRPTKAHEYLFVLAKNARYFYDQEAIREPATWDRWGDQTNGKYADETRGGLEKGRGAIIGARRREELQAMQANGRNKRSVWEIATESYPEAHFATFPQALVEPCVKAGTSECGVCPECGAPWKRIIEKAPERGSYHSHSRDLEGGMSQDKPNNLTGSDFYREYVPPKTVGWQPSCDCAGVDLTVIDTPTGDTAGVDPTLETGRKGMNRPRGDGAGRRPITRFEQARYARQLRASPARPQMEAEAGAEAFAHYLRTDKAGARPIPPELLERWVGEGWLDLVTVPEHTPPAPVAATVLDPFMGSGTTALVARRLGRRSVGVELNPEYAALAARRLSQLSLLTPSAPCDTVSESPKEQ